MTKITPYYERGGVTMYCDDCLEVMPTLECEVDAIISDPPYQKTALKWDVIIPFEPMWQNYKRLIKSNGAIVIFGSQPFSSMLVMSNLAWFKYEWVWEKDNVSSPAIAKFQPMRYHENIIVFCNGSTIYNPQKWDAGRKSNTPGKGGAVGMAGKRFSSNNIDMINQDTLRFPKSIIKFNKPKNNTGGIHPTQKPTDLIQYLVRTYSNPNDIILDNTAGSFTTAIACIREGRRFIGIEKELSYCEIGKERIIKELLAKGDGGAIKDTDTKDPYQVGFSFPDNK